MATERQKDKAVFPACIICSSCLQTDRFSFNFRHLMTTVVFAHSHVNQNLLFCLAVASPVNPGVKPTAPIDGTVICRSDTSNKISGPELPPPPSNTDAPAQTFDLNLEHDWWEQTHEEDLPSWPNLNAIMFDTRVAVSLASHSEYKVNPLP